MNISVELTSQEFEQFLLKTRFEFIDCKMPQKSEKNKDNEKEPKSGEGDAKAGESSSKGDQKEEKKVETATATPLTIAVVNDEPVMFLNPAASVPPTGAVAAASTAGHAAPPGAPAASQVGTQVQASAPIAASPAAPVALASPAAPGTLAIHGNLLLSSIDSYDGVKGSIEDFLRSVENIKNFAGWNDLTTISVAQCKLKGVALEFIQMKGQQASWADMKSVLLKRFSAPATEFAAFSELISCQQKMNETVAQYAQRIQLLSAKSLSGGLPVANDNLLLLRFFPSSSQEQH